MTTKEFAKILQDKLTSEYGVDLSVASKQQIYRSLALICRQMMSENHKKFQSKAIGTGTKQVYYLCMEFLMGRSLKVSLFNLGLEDVAQKVLADADINIEGIFEEEPDAGLGNGGLGRLAACYLDGMATTGTVSYTHLDPGTVDRGIAGNEPGIQRGDRHSGFEGGTRSIQAL